MIAQAIKRRMANPPFPVVSESHYKHFDKEVCDNWDTLRGKDKSTMRPRRAAGVSINSPLMAAGRSQPESGKTCTAGSFLSSVCNPIENPGERLGSLSALDGFG